MDRTCDHGRVVLVDPGPRSAGGIRGGKSLYARNRRSRRRRRLLPHDDIDFEPGIPVEMVLLQYTDGPMFVARPLAASG
jgi:hypothetical protein